jgi:hypothetical protein
VGPLVGGLLLAQNTRMHDVFRAAVTLAGIATLAAAAIAPGTRSPTQTRV